MRTILCAERGSSPVSYLLIASLVGVVGAGAFAGFGDSGARLIEDKVVSAAVSGPASVGSRAEAGLASGAAGVARRAANFGSSVVDKVAFWKRPQISAKTINPRRGILRRRPKGNCVGVACMTARAVDGPEINPASPYPNYARTFADAFAGHGLTKTVDEFGFQGAGPSALESVRLHALDDWSPGDHGVVVQKVGPTDAALEGHAFNVVRLEGDEVRFIDAQSGRKVTPLRADDGAGALDHHTTLYRFEASSRSLDELTSLMPKQRGRIARLASGVAGGVQTATAGTISFAGKGTSWVVRSAGRVVDGIGRGIAWPIRKSGQAAQWTTGKVGAGLKWGLGRFGTAAAWPIEKSGQALRWTTGKVGDGIAWTTGKVDDAARWVGQKIENGGSWLASKVRKAETNPTLTPTEGVNLSKAGVPAGSQSAVGVGAL